MKPGHYLLIALLAPLLALARPAAAEEQVMEIIPLQHRLVEDLIPVIRPLVDRGGTVTGMNDQLIVRTGPANLQAIKKVIARLDTAPRMLRITVTQDINAVRSTDEQSLSGHFRSGDVHARLPDAGRRHEGASIAIGDARGRLRYRQFSTRGRRDQRNVHFVQTLEGRPAWIQSGTEIPLAEQSVLLGYGGIVVIDGVRYKTVSSGFYVLPRVNGDRVTLDIQPRLERLDPRHPGRIDIQRTTSSVSGRLGEWIDLGGADTRRDTDRSADLTRTRRRGSERRSIWVRVDPAN